MKYRWSPSLALAFCLAACGSSSSSPPADASVEESPDTAAPLSPDAAGHEAAPDVAVVDTAAPADAAAAPEDTSPGDLAPPDTAPMGQYSATLNASTPYHVGGEHKGYTMFGTLVDTTPGAERARVGAIQSTVVGSDLLVKWVWPGALVKGHTYELAVFEDHLKNRTCMGSATAEPQWLFKIPAVMGDYEFKWIQPVPHTASCQDFPPGPLP